MDITDLIKDFNTLKEEYNKLVFGCEERFDRDGLGGIAWEYMDRSDRQYYSNRMEDVETAFNMLEGSIKEIPLLLSQQEGDH